MPSQHREEVLRQVGTLFRAGTAAGMTDGQLLERFSTRGGEEAELAFTALVERHGPMVLRVCRGVLRDPHDAEDAFQATFLVLARRADSIRNVNSVASWLYGVASRVSSCARAASARRRLHERRRAGMSPPSSAQAEGNDLAPVLHEEVARLPERLRAPVVLCALEGRTCEEAARLLGLPAGTVKSRLARARDRLRSRLIRQGLAPSAGFLATLSWSDSSAALSPTLAEAAARAASQIAAGHPMSGASSARVLTLAKGVLTPMTLTRLRMGTAAVLAGSCLIASATFVNNRAAEADDPTVRRAPPNSVTTIVNRDGGDDVGAANSQPWETVVRIKIQGDGSVGFCSGTIIESDFDESIILTCAHTFMIDSERQPRPASSSRRIRVDLFDGRPGDAAPAQIRPVETVDGQVIDCDFTLNLALLRIRPGRRLPASRIVPASWIPRADLPMTTIGCSLGLDPTVWSTIITNPRAC